MTTIPNSHATACYMYMYVGSQVVPCTYKYMHLIIISFMVCLSVVVLHVTQVAYGTRRLYTGDPASQYMYRPLQPLSVHRQCLPQISAHDMPSLCVWLVGAAPPLSSVPPACALASAARSICFTMDA